MASQTELPRHTDATRDPNARDAPKDLPYVDRIKVLSDLSLVPIGAPTADLHDFSVVTKSSADRGIYPAAPEVAPLSVTPEKVVKNDSPAPKVAPDSPMATLQSADATAQQKIEAVSKLYDTMPKDGKGRVHLTIHDGDKDKQFEISKEKLGHGVSLTHLTYRDEKGHTHPVLRGVERGGHVDQEKDKHGNKAEFKGDWWSKHAADSAISHFAPSVDTKAPPVPPIPDRDREKASQREPEKVVPLPPIPDRDHHPAPRHSRPGASSESEPGPREEPKHERNLAPERRSPPEDNNAPGSRGFSKVSDLHKFWVVQPSPHECGSAAEAMAISKITGRGPMSGSEIQRLSRENGTTSDGFNHGTGQRNMEMQLRHHGLNAETFNSFHGPHDQINQLDAELAKGHSAVAYIRNPDTRSHHGHFIFIDGKTADGKYVIGNSGSHTFGNYPAASRADLERWMQGEKHGAPYFTSVW